MLTVLGRQVIRYRAVTVDWTGQIGRASSRQERGAEANMAGRVREFAKSNKSDLGGALAIGTPRDCWLGGSHCSELLGETRFAASGGIGVDDAVAGGGV
jgi:hypothetical protein